MFGYITVNKDTLSEENKKIYQSYYCGLCQTMKSQYGRRAQMALNYDMTFLIVLLTGLYEPDSVTRDGFVCSVHPTKKRTLRTNEITEYAAAMNILLAYYNLIDDWKDDKSLTKKTYAEMLKKDFEKAKKGYPIQAKAIEDYIARLAECEKSNDTNIDAVAGLTGEMLGILFAWKQDEWQKDQKEFGCYMGKFIYIMEFKLNGTAEEALQQINDKHYALPFETDERKLFKIGVNFSAETRNIEKWIVES